MVKLRIEAALAHYNERVSDEKRLTKGQLAELVIQDNGNPNKDNQVARKRQMISRWIKGGTSGLTPTVTLAICKRTGVTPNFLFGIN